MMMSVDARLAGRPPLPHADADPLTRASRGMTMGIGDIAGTWTGGQRGRARLGGGAGESELGKGWGIIVE